MYFLLVLAPNSPVLVFFCMCLPHVFTHSPVLTAEMYSGSVYSVVFRQARSLKGYPALFLLQPAVTHPLRPFSYHFLSKSHPHTHTSHIPNLRHSQAGFKCPPPHSTAPFDKSKQRDTSLFLITLLLVAFKGAQSIFVNQYPTSICVP